MGSLHPSTSLPGGSASRLLFLRAASPESGIWKAAMVLALGLFLLPYTTGTLAWAYANGLFPFRPALYMMGTGSLCLLLTLTRRPDFTLAFGLICLFLLVRFSDGALLQRFPHPDGASDVFFSIGATMFSVLVIAAAIGVMHRGSLQPLAWVAACSILISSLSILAEWLGMGSFSKVEGRPSGFVGDPNDASIAIVIMLGVFLTIEKRFWLQVSLIGVAGAAVALSLSRSGVLVFVLLVFAYVVLNFRTHYRRFALCALATIPVGFLATAMILPELSSRGPGVGKNTSDRARAIFEGDLSRMGSSERLKDLRDGMDAITLRPILGHGHGAGTRKWQPHNQLFSIWIDVGILGAGLFALILGCLLVQSLISGGQALLCVLPLIAFVPFSQILADSAAFWCAALLAAALNSKRFWGLRVLADRSPGENPFQPTSLQPRG